MPQPPRAKAIAVLGTASDVGKSLLVAGLCRLMCRAGLRVAPFKAQNMSNNAAVTPEGGEIGRAQALQAQACGIEPHVDMNPILLKPESDERSQVVVQGRVCGRSDAAAYFGRTREFFQYAQDSYARLAQQYEAIVLEGAGSAAEMNLRDRDFVNWPMAHYADAPVLLVADIDRGGVFAQVLGTLDLLAPEDRRRVMGIVINKFRGRSELFADGRAFLEQRSGIPVLGVLPFLPQLRLDQEDSLDLRTSPCPFSSERVNIGVVLLPRMSNFTDFNALAAEPDVALRYIAEAKDLDQADVVVIPGSKDSIADLRYLKQVGFGQALSDHVARRRELVGLCGGYQMLGAAIVDSAGVESGGSEPGLRFLDVTTRLERTKITTRVEALPLHLDPGSSSALVQGYSIHMGRTTHGTDGPCFRTVRAGPRKLVEEEREEAELLDGAVSPDGLVWGTYIHGVFDAPLFRRAWLNRVRTRKGLPALDASVSLETTCELDRALDRWADHLDAHLDLRPVWAYLNQGATGCA